MAEYRYEWELILAGHGKNKEEAWEYLVDSVASDGLGQPADGQPDEPISRELVDPEYEPDAPLDTTPIKKRPQDGLWLIWSIEHFAWWAPGERGYVNYRAQAGRYTFERAMEIVRKANLYRRQRPPKEAMVLAED